MILRPTPSWRQLVERRYFALAAFELARRCTVVSDSAAVGSCRFSVYPPSRQRRPVRSASSGTPRAPALSGSVLGLSKRASVQLAAQLLRPRAHILQFVEAHRLLDVGGGGVAAP